MREGFVPSSVCEAIIGIGTVIGRVINQASSRGCRHQVPACSTGALGLASSSRTFVILPTGPTTCLQRKLLHIELAVQSDDMVTNCFRLVQSRRELGGSADGECLALGDH